MQGRREIGELAWKEMSSISSGVQIRPDEGWVSAGRLNKQARGHSSIYYIML